MSITKNAYVRFKILDEMLQSYKTYTTSDLCERCNQKLEDLGLPTVSIRAIQKDLVAMQERPFCAPINMEGKFRYYTDSSYSILYIELSEEERNLLYEVLSTLGQFDGLENFEWIKRYTIGLKLRERPKIMSFSTASYLEGSNMLSRLFEAISTKHVIKICYHGFDKGQKTYLLHPYLLKEYNNRWYLIGGMNEDDFIASFPIDRIESFEYCPSVRYRKCKVDLDKRYRDVVGISIPDGAHYEHILIWADDKQYPYIGTKHIVDSQRTLDGKDEALARKKYPNLEGGHFVTLDSIDNFELRRELKSYSDGLLVLEPEHLKNEILEELTSLTNKYLNLRT